MVIALLTIIHIAVCIALILIVLLQTGKGSELAGAFGGGTSNTAFGVTGAISFIGKMTTVAAFCFLFTSLSLSLLPIGKGGSSVIKEEAATQKPVENPSGKAAEPKKDVPINTSSSSKVVSDTKSGKAKSDEAGTKANTVKEPIEKKNTASSEQNKKKAP